MSTSIQLNDYFNHLAPSATLHINERVNQMWQAGETVYHLGFGESRFPVHPLLTAALGRHANAKSYLPARGLPALREAVARYYSRSLELDIGSGQVIIGPGSKALIYALQMAVAGPLYLPAPSWVSYAPQARMLGKTVHWIPGSPANHYRLDLAAFERLLDRDDSPQKMLIINSPNNPTGAVLDDKLLCDLVDLCRRHNVLVLSDEIYYRVTHKGFRHRSIASDYPDGSVILGGLSKHLSVGGWRLGVAIAPKSEDGTKLMSALTAIASETWSAVASPLQHAALVAYSGETELEQYVDTCAEIHALRTGYLYRQLCQMGIVSTPPQGAFYLTVNFDHWAPAMEKLGITTSVELAAHLLDKHRIATLPGAPFGLSPQMLSLRLAASYLDMESDEAAQSLLDLYRSGIDAETFTGRDHHPNMHACLDAFRQFVADF